MKNGEEGKVESHFYQESKHIMDQIRKIPAEKNEQYNLQIRENLADKFSKIKKTKQ